ncbi:unnamed protein product [Phytophthora fragariaefolia]|uniref:Unnamed protein product n=1 Tax=Phytophthora fragariaefolia TaxID=1490495 RepID=A0A9W6XFZ3_9STRA|nr:unnamed protein product [Phytophthora fragariaefolia]
MLHLMLTVTMNTIVNIMQHAKMHVMLYHIVHYILQTNVLFSWIIVDDEGNEEAEVTARGTELLADNDDDLNSIETNASGQYGAIESGDKAEKDDVETGEYESGKDGRLTAYLKT